MMNSIAAISMALMVTMVVVMMLMMMLIVVMVTGHWSLVILVAMIMTWATI